MYLPQGAFAPVPTPFSPTGTIEGFALRAHLAWLEQEGLQGALILGTNGEFPSLTFAEKRAVAYAAARSSPALTPPYRIDTGAFRTRRICFRSSMSGHQS